MVQDEPGRVVIRELEGDPDYTHYWHAFIGELRINGGVCNDYTHGMFAGREAIGRYRRQVFLEAYYWDDETHEWYEKGTLPPVS